VPVEVVGPSLAVTGIPHTVTVVIITRTPNVDRRRKFESFDVVIYSPD
jgi:hypothetical protein